MTRAARCMIAFFTCFVCLWSGLAYGQVCENVEDFADVTPGFGLCMFPIGHKTSSDFKAGCLIHTDRHKAMTRKFALYELGSQPGDAGFDCAERRSDKCNYAIHSLICSTVCPRCGVEFDGAPFQDWIDPEFLTAVQLPQHWPDGVGIPCYSVYQEFLEACAPEIEEDCFFPTPIAQIRDAYENQDVITSDFDGCTNIPANPDLVNPTWNAPEFYIPLLPESFNQFVGIKDTFSKVTFIRLQEADSGTRQWPIPAAIDWNLITPNSKNKARVQVKYELDNWIYPENVDRWSIQIGYISKPTHIQQWRVTAFNYESNSWDVLGNLRTLSKAYGAAACDADIQKCKWTVTDIPVDSNIASYYDPPEVLSDIREMKIRLETGYGGDLSSLDELYLDFIHVLVWPRRRAWGPLLGKMEYWVENEEFRLRPKGGR
eukprot:TRINITY_DN369_c0_g1_i3.p1 TRINITY_DN369_c0_g1~~TRINITY_DN369_c0_g1_i3.p1  ORF type:complete len:442 (-),score=28.38 TRINITY_DN369_c0_g1_i3:78-1367(-)